MDDVDIEEIQVLKTRAREYVKVDNHETNSTPKPKRTARNKNFFLCKVHHTLPQEWKEECNDCNNCFKIELLECLPLGVLPNGQEVLEYLITLKTQNPGSRDNYERKVAKDLVLQWIFCNVYPKALRKVEKDIISLFEYYKTLKKRAKSKKSDEYWVKYDGFVKKQMHLFDIIGE